MRGNELNLMFGTQTIYHNASFQINENEKIGIVGVNGAGKTTLFKVILNEQNLDSGKITIRDNKNIGYLPQEINYRDQKKLVLDYLLSARPIEQLQKEIEKQYIELSIMDNKDKQNKLLKEISKKQDVLDSWDPYNAENILFDILENMSVNLDLLDMKLSDLSGGQKSKIAFAHLLYSNPEILLLDEPTNHLDNETRTYITNYLKNYKGMVLIISHDIKFLDEVTENTLYLDKVTNQIKKYNGNYSTFLAKLEREKELNERLVEKQEREEKELKDFILQYSNSSGKRKRIAQSREKLLTKKQSTYVTRIEETKQARINIKPNREGSKIPLKINGISFNYPDKDNIINNLSFSIGDKERFLIVGENGVGKSTLLKLLVKKLIPNEGNIWYGSKTDIAYYAQELEELDLNKNVIQNLDSANSSERELRTLLGGFLFNGDDVFKNVKNLSPGEKSRLMLAKIMLKRANLLILDEPTNHLDPETQKIIGNNFANYSGTIIVVSHNPDFVEQIGINRMLILPSGKITNYSREKLDYYYKLNSGK